LCFFPLIADDHPLLQHRRGVVRQFFAALLHIAKRRVTLMSKMPLFFVLVVAVIVVAASFRYVQQRREKLAS
jgi:hypothetical protein